MDVQLPWLAKHLPPALTSPKKCYFWRPAHSTLCSLLINQSVLIFAALHLVLTSVPQKHLNFISRNKCVVLLGPCVLQSLPCALTQENPHWFIPRARTLNAHIIFIKLNSGSFLPSPLSPAPSSYIQPRSQNRNKWKTHWKEDYVHMEEDWHPFPDWEDWVVPASFAFGYPGKMPVQVRQHLSTQGKLPGKCLSRKFWSQISTQIHPFCGHSLGKDLSPLPISLTALSGWIMVR